MKREKKRAESQESLSSEAKSLGSRPLSLDSLLNDIEVPALDVPDLDASFASDQSKDLFADKKRAAWKDCQTAEARCDFAPNKVRISYRNPQFGIISLWK